MMGLNLPDASGPLPIFGQKRPEPSGDTVFKVHILHPSRENNALYIRDGDLAVEGLQVMLKDAYTEAMTHYPLLAFYHVPIMAFAVPAPSWWPKRDQLAQAAR